MVISKFDLENTRSRSWPRSNPMVTFEARSSIYKFARRFVAIEYFWLRCSRWCGESLTRRNRFEPISARRGLGKPAPCLTSLGQSNWLCLLPKYTLSLGDPWHALSHLTAAIEPKLVHLKQWDEKHLQSMPQRCLCPNFKRQNRMVAALQRHKLNMF